ERAVREVRDLHEPEDQREARGEQEEEAAERDAVDCEQQPEAHNGRGPRRPPPDLPQISMAAAKSPLEAFNPSSGGSGASTRAARGATCGRPTREGVP